MIYTAANFEYNGGTIGFISDSLVALHAKESAAYSKKQFGKTAFTEDMLTKKILVAHEKAYIPQYNIVGAHSNDGSYPGVYLCVAKAKYGEIGTFLEIRMTHSANNKPDSFSFMAVIAEHLENMPDSPPDHPGAWKGVLKCDSELRSVELSVIVNDLLGFGSSDDDKGGSNVGEWLGAVRWRFFELGGRGSWTTEVNGKTTTYYTYRTARIESISTDLALNEGAVSETTVNEDAASSDFLLQNSEDEKKYGINIYEVAQPLIRFETAGALTGGANGNALEALKSYSRFMYSLLNSQVSTANYMLVSMPWLRPGFNCWVDPLYTDTVYYISEVQHQGSPTDGATTVVSLIFGRPRGEFISNSEAFGSMNNTSDNVFVNTMNSEQRIKGSDGVGPWGAYLEDAAAFQNVKIATEDYYGHEISGTTPANASQFHKSMYVDGVKSAPLADNVDTSKIFNGEYSAEEIKAKIDAIYASAPNVVKERSTKLKTAVEGARKYIKLHYDSEKRG